MKAEEDFKDFEDSPYVKLIKGRLGTWFVLLSTGADALRLGADKVKAKALEQATDNLAKAYADVVELSEGKKKKK